MAIIDSGQTLKSLKSWKEFPDLILLFGEEEVLLKDHLKAIRSQYLKLYGDVMTEFNLEKFHAETAPVEKVIESCLTFPCGNKKKLVILEHLEKYSPTSKSKIEEYCGSSSSTTTLLVTWITKLNASLFSSAFVSKFVSKGYAIKYWKLFEERRPYWIEEQCTSHGYKISHDAAELLSEEGGETLGDLKNEIEKLKIYCKGTLEITLAKVKEALSFKRASSLWSFIDSLEAGEKVVAGKILEACLAQGEEPIKIVYFIARSLRKNSSKYTRGKLRAVFQELKETDRSLKTGENLEAARLERLLLKT